MTMFQLDMINLNVLF